jgi:hypothetical protein
MNKDKRIKMQRHERNHQAYLHIGNESHRTNGEKGTQRIFEKIIRKPSPNCRKI